MRQISLLTDHNLLGGMLMGDHWVFVDSRFKALNDLEPQEIATLVVLFTKQKHDTENTKIHLLQSNNIPIGTLNPEEYMEGDDKKAYLTAKKGYEDADEVLALVSPIWEEKYADKFVVKGYGR